MTPASGWHVDSNTLSYFTLCNTECRRDVIKNIYRENTICSFVAIRMSHVCI